VVAVGADDGYHVWVRDHLVQRDVDVVAVARRPEDGGAQSAAPVGGRGLEGEVEDGHQGPVGAVGAEAGDDDVRAVVCVGGGHLGGGVGSVGDGPRQGGLAAHLVGEAGDEH